MKTAIYPGSFDPCTIGHLDIIRRASVIFDRLFVACMVNPRKKSMFTREERVAMLRDVAKRFPNVEVGGSDGLLAEYAKEVGADVIIKGLRAMTDFEYEFQMALLNSKMNPGLDTLFLTTGETFQSISSSAIKEAGLLGADVRDLVPEEVYERLRERLCAK